MSLLSVASLFIKRSIVLRSQFSHQYSYKNVTSKPFSSTVAKSIHDVNTNVKKDVILFQYENPKFFKYMNLFAVVQYMFWAYLGTFAFSNLRDAPVDQSKITDDTPWYRRVNLGENKYKNTLGSVALIIGTGSLAVVWLMTLKSVRYLILNKGGKHLTFVTYTPFGHNRIMKVPLECVCCKEKRTNATVQLPIKVKNTWMHYIVDMKGQFKHPALFDSTAGLARKW